MSATEGESLEFTLENVEKVLVEIRKSSLDEGKEITIVSADPSKRKIEFMIEGDITEDKKKRRTIKSKLREAFGTIGRVEQLIDLSARAALMQTLETFVDRVQGEEGYSKKLSDFFSALENQYIMDANHNVIPAESKEIAFLYLQFHRNVTATHVGKYWVSTAFLGSDHRGYREEGKGPLVFKTMIFRDGESICGPEFGEYQTRCSTWDEAFVMHQADCDYAMKLVLDANEDPYVHSNDTTHIFEGEEEEEEDSKEHMEKIVDQTKAMIEARMFREILEQMEAAEAQAAADEAVQAAAAAAAQAEAEAEESLEEAEAPAEAATDADTVPIIAVIATSDEDGAHTAVVSTDDSTMGLV